MTEKIIPQSEAILNLFDTNEEDKLRKELDELLPEARRYIHEVYDIFPQDSPESQELLRIVKQGKNGLGLESKHGNNPTSYYLINSHEETAFALGTEVYISTAFINKSKDEDILASFPSHEIEHVNGEHLLKKEALKRKIQSLRGVFSTGSIGRIHETEAEIAAPFKLQQGGYDPSAYRDMLNLFLEDHEDDNRGRISDIDHGSVYDRLSIQYYILKSEDLTGTTNERTPKPAILEHLPEGFNRYERIVNAIQKTDTSTAEDELQQLSFETVLSFYSLAYGDIQWKSSQQKNEKKTKQENKKNPPEHLELQLHVLEFFYNKIEQHIQQQFPDLQEPQRTWAVLSILSKKTDSNFFSSAYHDELLTSYNLEYWIPRISLTARFRATVPTSKDFLIAAAFIGTFREDATAIIKDGATLHSNFWGLILGNFPTPGKLNELLQWYKQDGFFDEQKRINLTEVAAFLEHIRNNAQGTVHPDEKPLWRIVSALERLSERDRDEELHKFIEHLHEIYGEEFEEHTLELCQQHEAEILPSLVERYIIYQQLATHYDDDDAIGSMFRNDIFPVARDLRELIHKYYSYGSEDFISERFEFYMSIYLQQIHPDEFSLYQGFAKGTIDTSLVTYLENHEYSELLRFFAACPFLLIEEQTALTVYSRLEHYIAEHIEQGTDETFNDAKFRMILHDATKLTFDFLHLQLSADESADYILSVNNDTEKYGFSSQEIQVMYQLDLLDFFARSFGEEKTIQIFTNILNSINLDMLSEPSKILLLSAILKNVNDISAHFRHGDDFDTDDDDVQTWSEIFIHPTLLALRDAYQLRFETEGITLHQECTAIFELAELLGGRGSRNVSFISKNEDHGLFLSPLVTRVMEKIKQYPFDRNSVQDLFDLRSLMPFFEDRRFNTIIKNKLEYQIVQKLNFQDAVEFMNQLLNKRSLNFSVFDYIQENLLKTPEDLETFQSVWERFREKLSEQGDASVGIAAIFDAGFERFMSKHAVELFEAALLSGSDDTKLRTILAKRWFDIYVDPFPIRSGLDIETMMAAKERPYRIQLIKQGNDYHFEIEGTNIQQFVPFETFLEQIYTSLTQTEIDFMLRKMLYSNEGILVTQQGRRTLHKLFMEAGVNKQHNPNLAEFLDDVVTVLLSLDTKRRSEMVISDINLGEPISGILRKKLFVKPGTPGSNTDGAKIIADQFDGSKLGTHRRFLPRTKQQQQIYDAHAADINERLGLPKLTEEQVRQLLAFNPAYNNHTGITNFELSQLVNATKEYLLSFVDTTERDTISQPLIPIQTLILIANSKQTFGERFKQMLGYYMDLAPLSNEERSEIHRSYSQVRGQLKYTAYRTIKREALKIDASEALRNFWDNLETLESTGHGGSLTTVFKAQMKDGSQKAVKVMVPNALLFIRETKKEAKEFITRLRRKPKNRKNLQLKIAEAMIDDIAEWAEADIATTEYEKQDIAFRTVHEGTVLAGKSSIELRVPTMTPTGSMYIKIEDWIEGKTLLDTMQHGSMQTAQDVLALVKQNYHAQQNVSVGEGMYQIHSNLHAGQFQIVEDEMGEKTYVYVLDRGYWLEFSEEEATFFPFITGEEFSSQKAVDFLQYLFRLPENKKLTRPQKIAITSQVTMTGGASFFFGSDATETALVMMLELRKAGVKIPIKWTLFQQNNQFLHSTDTII